jgi:hypothetical protein
MRLTYLSKVLRYTQDRYNGVIKRSTNVHFRNEAVATDVKRWPATFRRPPKPIRDLYDHGRAAGFDPNSLSLYEFRKKMVIQRTKGRVGYVNLMKLDVRIP